MKEGSVGRKEVKEGSEGGERKSRKECEGRKEGRNMKEEI